MWTYRCEHLQLKTERKNDQHTYTRTHTLTQSVTYTHVHTRTQQTDTNIPTHIHAHTITHTRDTNKLVDERFTYSKHHRGSQGDQQRLTIHGQNS